MTLTENTRNPIAHLSSPKYQNCIIIVNCHFAPTVPPVGPRSPSQPHHQQLPSTIRTTFQIPHHPSSSPPFNPLSGRCTQQRCFALRVLIPLPFTNAHAVAEQPWACSSCSARCCRLGRSWWHARLALQHSSGLSPAPHEVGDRMSPQSNITPWS